jgi:2',3'-cyclic-nucleotide 2'-phosphodiesterase (5'-nucleotidase family)
MIRIFPWLCVVVLALGCASAKEPLPAPGATSPPAPEPKSALPDAPLFVAAKKVGVDGEVAEDPEIVALLAPRAARVEAAAKRLVGHLDRPLGRGKPESTMGNFVTDSMRQAMEAATGKIPDLCFTNMGGLRRDLPAGAITAGMVTELMPFDNSLVVFELDGASLKIMMERLAARGDALSGGRYVREGDRLHDVTVGGKDLDLHKTYRVCTNDYLFDGGGNYPLAPAKKVNTTGVLLRDALLSRFEDASAQKVPIEVSIEGRAVWREQR